MLLAAAAAAAVRAPDDSCGSSADPSFLTLASRTMKLKLAALILALCVASANAVNTVWYDGNMCAPPSTFSTIVTYSGGDGKVANLAQVMATVTSSEGTSVFYHTYQIGCPAGGDAVTVQVNECTDATSGTCVYAATQVYTRENWKKACAVQAGCFTLAHTNIAGVTETVSGTASGAAATQLNCLQEDGAAATRISVMAAAVALVSALALL